jgi:hypothetical protein
VGKSWSYLGDTFELPPGYDSERAKNYLAGSHFFIVSEIQAYKVTLL